MPNCRKKMAASLKAELIKVDDYPFADKTGYRQHLKRVSGVDRKGDRKKGKRKK